LINFYATTGAIAQQGVGPANIFVGNGVNDTALLTKYQITNATSAVTATTTLEVTSTVTGILATDVIAVNKPAAQAGLGIAGYRVSAANTIGVTYTNISSGSITPTAEAYDVIGISSALTTTASLTPVAVPATPAGAEQIFAVPGATVGSFPIVNKPTAQAGLGITNVRVVSAGQVGITFLNNSSGAITPTAAETYSFAFLPTLNPASSNLVYKVALSAATVAATTTTDQSTTITGLLATDTIAGVSKPTYQAGIGIAGYRVGAANQINVTYISQSSGAVTTTVEANFITVLRQVAKAPFVVTSQALTPVSVAAGTTAEQTFTVNSLSASTSALVAKPSFTPGLHVVGARVSAASTLAITYQNSAATAIVPPAETYMIAAIPLQGPGANSVGSTTNAIAVSVNVETSAVRDLRNVLGNLNLLASI
jgi:hypothetical protein